MPNFLLKILNISVILLVMMAIPAIADAQTVYVSDELSIPMRSGDTLSHRILKFINSGTPLEVLETNETQTHYRVQIDDKEGWVEIAQIMDKPGARSQLVTLNKYIARLKTEIDEHKNTVKTLKTEISGLQSEKKALEQQEEKLTGSLDKLKQVAARPAAIAQQNKELEAELTRTNNEFMLVKDENKRLHDRSIKEWFMIGAGVSLVSLFLGLIIPNIKWRKRGNWGSDF